MNGAPSKWIGIIWSLLERNAVGITERQKTLSIEQLTVRFVWVELFGFN